MHCDLRTRKVCVCVRLGRCGVYTSRRTHRCCYWLSNSIKKLIETRLDMRSDFLVVGDNLEIVVWSRLSASQLVALTTSLEREFEVVSLTIALTNYRPANCVGAIFASSKSMKTSSTRMNLVTSWMRRMADDILLRNVLLHLCSATQGTLAVKDQSCYVRVSFTFRDKMS